MSQINPFTGSIVQSTSVAQRAASDKDRQARRLENLRKNVALQDDQLEHQVESTEELKPLPARRDEDQSRQRQPRQRRPAKPANPNDDPHIDLTA